MIKPSVIIIAGEKEKEIFFDDMFVKIDSVLGPSLEIVERKEANNNTTFTIPLSMNMIIKKSGVPDKYIDAMHINALENIQEMNETIKEMMESSTRQGEDKTPSMFN